MIAVHETLAVRTDAPAMLLIAIAILLVSLLGGAYGRR